MGPDTYMVSRQGGSGLMSTGTLKAEASREAIDFCSTTGKQFLITHTQDSPAWPGHFPQAEIQFMCLSPGDPELKRPKMARDPSQVIEIRK